MIFTLCWKRRGAIEFIMRELIAYEAGFGVIDERIVIEAAFRIAY